MATHYQIVQHPRSGERYILATTQTPGGNVYRAAGPLRDSEAPDPREMESWLRNQGQDAYDDGDWLSDELYRGES